MQNARLFIYGHQSMFTAKREMLLNPDPEQIARLFIFSRKNIDFQAVMQFVFRLNDKNIQ